MIQINCTYLVRIVAMNFCYNCRGQTHFIDVLYVLVLVEYAILAWVELNV